MARTKKVDASNSGEFKHRSYVGENGETLYDAPIEIKNNADMGSQGMDMFPWRGERENASDDDHNPH